MFYILTYFKMKKGIKLCMYQVCFILFNCIVSLLNFKKLKLGINICYSDLFVNFIDEFIVCCICWWYCFDLSEKLNTLILSMKLNNELQSLNNK